MSDKYGPEYEHVPEQVMEAVWKVDEMQSRLRVIYETCVVPQPLDPMELHQVIGYIRKIAREGLNNKRKLVQ